ncbi:CheB methylesterase domain-containing protein [Clostridium sp. AM58-1XD]|uniref:CheB methylesterase domain-containing protein n=1 Tax=Clostridium sp. AM58-1XD TaxID=2292307 RepID=UPI0015F42C78|nr:CheB methylesterase domain-containing protein [Clostridium sp. AM58-1XD]
MNNIKVMLMADTPAAGRKILDVLRIEPGISVFVNQDSQSEKKMWMNQDTAVLTFGTSAYLEQKLPLIHSLIKEGLPVICIARTEDGLEKLRRLKGCTVIKCRASHGGHDQSLFEKELLVKVKSCYGSGSERRRGLEGLPSRHMVGIGASTGGPKALLTVLQDLPPDTCGIVVVQHLSRGFAANFAHYMDQNCRIHARQAASEEVIRDGNIYVASEGCQMRVKKQGDQFLLHTRRRDGKYDFCPSVDCLFESMAEAAGSRAMGIILTGMGADGAMGILKMKEAGAYTVGQDQATSAIYSMLMRH